MMRKLINKLFYKLKYLFRNLFFYFRYFKNKNKDHWSVKEFSTYDKYLEFQKEKTLDKITKIKMVKRGVGREN